jgi:hypothetical protein
VENTWVDAFDDLRFVWFKPLYEVAQDAGVLWLAFFVAIAFGGYKDIDNREIIVVYYVSSPFKITIFHRLSGYCDGHPIHFWENYISFHLSRL